MARTFHCLLRTPALNKKVTLLPGKFFDEAELVIKVEDVNDHTPMFGSDEYPITVREDVQPGTPLLQIS